MKTIVNHTFVPAGSSNFHHFTITRTRLANEHTDRIRIAYQLVSAESQQITTDLTVDACAAAAWNLSPDAHAAFLHQLTHGWRGTAESYQG